MNRTETAETKSGLKNIKNRDHIVYYIPAAVAIFLVNLALQPVNGYIGHDYYHYEARTLFGLVHFYQSFPEIPHYNPYLCGGLPYFADPQCYYYSLHQVLALFIDPYQAALLTVFFFNIIAYFSTLILLKKMLHIDIRIAHLCSLVFILNGFSFANLFVGHVTHHSYLLIPAVLLLLFYGPSHFIKGAVFLALVLGYIYYSGGMHVLVVLFFTGILVLPYLVYRNYREKKLLHMLLFFGLTLFLLILACSGKFIAGVLYSKQFIQRGVDHPSENVFLFITRYFWFLPGEMPELDSVWAGDAVYGMWEFIGFVSKIVLPGMAGMLLLIIKNFRKNRIAFYIINIAVISIVMLICYGAPFNDYLPFFRGYHNAMKLLGAVIPFFVIVTALGLNFLSGRIPGFMNNRAACLVAFSIISSAMLFEYKVYTDYFIEKEAGTTYLYANEIYKMIRKEKKAAPVSMIIDKLGCDITAFTEGTSSLDSSEMSFGYGRENLGALGTLSADSIYTVNDDYYNMTHPGALVYPDFFRLEPWSGIPVTDHDMMENFVRAKSPNFGIPVWQDIIIICNGIVIIWLVICGLFFTVQSVRKKAAGLFRRQE